MVSHVRDGSEQIATGTAQITSGNADLSQRTEEQSQSVQRTASSMVLLTGLLEHNARSTEEATALVQSASQAATQGGEVMGRLVKTMATIEQRLPCPGFMPDPTAVAHGSAPTRGIDGGDPAPQRPNEQARPLHMICLSCVYVCKVVSRRRPRAIPGVVANGKASAAFRCTPCPGPP